MSSGTVAQGGTAFAARSPIEEETMAHHGYDADRVSRPRRTAVNMGRLERGGPLVAPRFQHREAIHARSPPRSLATS